MTMNTTHAHTHALTEAPAVDRRLSIDARLGSASAFLTRAGQGFSRWSLVLVLVAFGLYKFTAVEAAAIRPMVEHSPLMSWLYRVTSEQGASNVVGLVESRYRPRHLRPRRPARPKRAPPTGRSGWRC
jgi:hypothetical protein